MNVKEFYSDESIDVWKKVIGQDLHYHIGWGKGDILYNAIEYLYPVSYTHLTLPTTPYV